MNGPEPILVAGLPKTGTTALAASIAAGVGGATAFEPRTVEQASAVEDCRVIKIVYPPHEQRTLAEVMEEFGSLEKRVWIVRDPRDQLVSAFLYAWFKGHRMPAPAFEHALSLVRRREAGEQIPFLMMLREVFGPDTFIHDSDYHGRRVLSFVRSDEFKNVHVFRYDDLVRGRFEGLSRYLGVPVSAAAVDKVHERVARTRGTGGWRSWFMKDDRRPCKTLFGPYMKATRQRMGWRLDSTPPDPRHGSWYMAWLWAGGTGPRPQSEAECQALLEAAASK